MYDGFMKQNKNHDPLKYMCGIKCTSCEVFKEFTCVVLFPVFQYVTLLPWGEMVCDGECTGGKMYIVLLNMIIG